MNSARVILGIVAEYDPFHNGHKYHLDQAQKAVSPDTVYAVLSPCLKQRGEPALFSPHRRAECAVRAGIDAVFSLPVLWTVRDAEHYTLGAVSLLCGLGITHLAFGAEEPDPVKLQFCADFLDNPPSEFPERLKKYLSEGMGYPSALSNAAASIYPETGKILSGSNNILAVCYLRALKKCNSRVRPVIIPRQGAYHDSRVDPFFPSASAIRNALARGNYPAAFQAVPAFSASLIQDSFLSRRIPDISVWDSLLLEKLRNTETKIIPDLSEGLDDALRKAAAASSASDDPVSILTSKRYTASRISRLCAMAALGVSADRLRSLPLPSVTLLLAIRKLKVPTDQWRDLPVRIASSAVEWRKIADPEDLAAWRLWSICCHLPDTLPFSEKVYSE